MKKIVVFVDRDGVINFDPGNFHKIDELKILPKVAEAVKILNANKIPVVVVTNQPVVARGWISEEEVNQINMKITKTLEKDGAKLAGFYFCPHHPNANVLKYRLTCDCRKPNIGLFERAAYELGINVKKSFVIGDSFRDVEAAKKLGCRSIAVESGSSDFRESKPDFKTKDFYTAVKLILSLI